MSRRTTSYETPTQEIELDDISSFDTILDVGAGGEGLAARIGKDKVCGIDVRVDEIKEMRDRGVDCSWTVADARNLGFKPETFDLVTVWFSLMYVTKRKDKISVLSECKRVLKRGGVLNLMDSRINVQEDVFILKARFKLPNGQIVSTGYGVSASQKQDHRWLKQVLAEFGFSTIRENIQEYRFSLACRK